MDERHGQRDLGFGPAAVLQAMKSSVRLLRWGLLLLLLIYLFSGVTVVGPNETAFVLRFGKLQPGLHSSGLLLALPQPIDEVVKVPTRSVQEIRLDAWAASPVNGMIAATLNPIRDGYTLTGDANIIQARFSVRYQVSDPVAYALAVKDQPALLEAVLYQAATEVIAQMTVDEVLASGLESLRAQTLRIAQAQLDRLGMGVQLLAFEVHEISPALQVVPAFQDVVSARVESQTLIEQANSYRASELPAARADAYRIKQEADSYGQDLVAKATGESAAFEAIEVQYKAAPQLMRTRLYADAMETILHQLQSTLILQPSGSNLKLLLQPSYGSPPLSITPQIIRDQD
ncbi:MAG TPA: FtsH protease activity modulator HflK [Verrucomicrobiae bacterium]|nr:FtsH protease activity modulator HflK [Verrucomicrobiae bacterium]